MTDKNDIIHGRMSLAQSFYRALSRWRKTIVIVPLGAVVFLVAVTVVRNRIPQSARAHPQQIPATNASAMEFGEITFIRLPRVPGRHDRIAGDFFVREQDTVALEVPSPLNRVSAPVVAPAPAGEDTLGAGMDDALQLKAIILGQCPKALINDELVTIGDTVPFDESAEGEYKVVAINENAVVLMWGTVKTVLQLRDW
jgi:hypothetical protein